MNTSVLEMARGYRAARLSVIPVALDGTKQPAFDALPRVADPERPDRTKASWKPFQTALASDDDLVRWFGRSRPYAIAVATGAVSGGAEVIDLDDKETAREFCALVRAEEPALYARLSLESTPRGVHVWYRTDVREGNRVLAGRPDGFDPKGRPKVKKTIETRGEGGYAVVAGSPLAAHELGTAYEHAGGPPLTALERITDGDRDYLFRLAMSFDRTDQPGPTAHEPQRHRDGGTLSPGDDFDLRGEPFSQLIPDAVFSDTTKDEGRVRRPGKERGNSATVGYCRGPRGEPLLRVFTSNWAPFEANRCYGRFQVLRLLRFGGDGAAATRHLRERGFGSPTAPGGSPGAGDPAPEAHASREWPAPVPLGLAPEVPEFPVEVLPPWLATFVRAQAVELQVPADLPALLVLGAAAGGIARKVTVTPWAGWENEPTNLFVMPCLPPGERKSQSFSKVFAPVAELERELRREAEPLVREAESEVRILQKRVEYLEAKISKCD